MKAVKLKLGTRMHSGLIIVYTRIKVKGLDRFYNFPLMKKIVTLFSRTERVQTWTVG